MLDNHSRIATTQHNHSSRQQLPSRGRPSTSSRRRPPPPARPQPWSAPKGSQLPQFDAFAPDARRVCISGSNVVQGSQATWHFIQGHLMEAMALLLSHGLYAPDVALFFDGHPTYTRRNASLFLAFYAPLFDAWPQGVENCSEAVVGPNATRLSFPPMKFGQDGAVKPSRAGLPAPLARLEFSRAVARGSSMWQTCRLTAPVLQQRAHAFAMEMTSHRHHHAAEGSAGGGGTSARRGDERHVRMLTFVRRGKSGRRITNPTAVEADLRRFASASSLSVRVVFLEQLSAAEQVSLATRTALLVAYHGSGVGALHVWMPQTASVVEVAPPRWPYCLFSMCAHATGKRYILSSIHDDEVAEVWKPGGFDAIKVPFGPTSGRATNLSAALAVVARLRRGESVASNACGGRMIQVWEPPPPPGTPPLGRLPYLEPIAQMPAAPSRGEASRRSVQGTTRLAAARHAHLLPHQQRSTAAGHQHHCTLQSLNRIAS